MRARLSVAILVALLSLVLLAALGLAFNVGGVLRPLVVVRVDEEPRSPAALLTPTEIPFAEPPGAQPPAVRTPSVQPPPDRYSPPPARDLYDLARRLRPGYLPPTPEPPVRAAHQVGDRRVFWVVDLDALVPFTVTATLQHVTPHTYFYIQDGHEVAQADLRRSAEEFEQRIYPTVHRYVGTEWLPGIDGDEHLTVLNARIPGVAGYYSMVDEYPRSVNPYSNEREMIYMNLSAVRPGTSGYNAVLAHEFTHAVHWNIHRNEESWLSEGLAELSAMLAGYRSNFTASYAASPDTQLTAWPMGMQGNAAHYGAAYLFMMYLTQHYGGHDALREIIAQTEDGVEGINAYLAKRGYAARFEDVFRDWLVANYLDDPSVERYHYPDVDIRAKVERVVDDYGEWSATVQQFGADYVELRPPAGGARVDFTGNATVPLAALQPYSGRRMWWSNRGDAINSTLTRPLDLTSVGAATLTYRVWYDIERNWDFAYVEASTDGGATWTILRGLHSSPENPLGLSFGPGYTGQSGEREPEWREERVDLSPYAGRRILLRFEYVTDEGTNGPSFFVDDIAVPELSWLDDVEGESQWQAAGFLRTDGILPQRHVLQLIRFGRQTVVESIHPDAQGHATFTLGGPGESLQRAILIIGAATPVTTEAAEYRVSMEPLQ